MFIEKDILALLKQRFIQAMEDFAVKRAVAKVIEWRTHYGFTGHPHVRTFEKAISQKLDGTAVLGANSGTDALILALKVLGIGHSDEVIVPAFSFISTASCISWIGASPVFVDIRLEDYAIDPTKIEKKITSKTKAIIVAHLFGQPTTGISEIINIAKRRSIPVIEDAAQSFGARIKNNGAWKMTGAIGDIGCLSFSSTKAFAAPGNGGAIVFRQKDPRYEIVDKMRFYGAKRHYFDYPFIGINIKLHDIQAAALLAKLPFMNDWLSHRKELAMRYKSRLSRVADLTLPEIAEGTERIWYRYVIRYKKRDELFNHIAAATKFIPRLQPTRNYPVPLPYFSAFQGLGHKPGDFPIADIAAAETLSLPITNFVSLRDVDKICDIIESFYT